LYSDPIKDPMKYRVHLLVIERQQMTTKNATVAVVCGILAIFLLEVLAVLAWA
jgi:hypothetical protein